MSSRQKRFSSPNLIYDFAKAFNQVFPNMLLPIFVLFYGIGIYLTSLTDSRDFGMNFLAEMTGIVVTVYVVEFFYRRMDRIKKVPARIVLWKRLVKAFDQFFLMWQSAYHKLGVPISDSYEDVFDEKMFTEMMKKLSLNGYVCQEASFTWADLIEQIAEQTRSELDQIISVHSGTAEPDLISHLTELSESDFLGSMCDIQKLHQLRNVKNDSFYEASLKPDTTFFEIVIETYRWLILEEINLKRMNPSAKLSTTFRSRHFDRQSC